MSSAGRASCRGCLPELRPGRYAAIRPPAALAHAAGHAWEQLALPLAARGAELLLSPANLAPLAGRRNVVVIHDSAPFRDPAWYGRAYGAWHRAAAAPRRRGAPARDRAVGARARAS